jgi:drug/metabolite transporter (DMT)-like permease
MAISPRVAALLGAACLAFSGIFYRLSGASPSTATLFRCLYALPLLFLLGWLEDRHSGGRARRDRLICMLAGVFFAFDLVPWQHAVNLVGAGLATTITNLSVIVVGVLGWLLLRERPTARMLGGLVLVVGGAVLISGVLEKGAYGSDPPLGVAFGLVAACSYSGYLLLIRHGNRDGRHAMGALGDATVAAAVCAAIEGIVVGDIQFVPYLPAHAWLLLVALTSQVAGYGLVNVSLPRLPAVLTSILLLLQPAMTVFFAWLILAETPSWLQLGGVALVMAGVVVAAAARSRRTAAPDETAGIRPTTLAVPDRP